MVEITGSGVRKIKSAGVVKKLGECGIKNIDDILRTNMDHPLTLFHLPLLHI